MCVEGILRKTKRGLHVLQEMLPKIFEVKCDKAYLFVQRDICINTLACDLSHCVSHDCVQPIVMGLKPQFVATYSLWHLRGVFI